MSSQSLNLKIAGLQTNFNDLSSAPEGALLVAENIVIDSFNLAEPRRGFGRLPVGFSDSDHRCDALFSYQDKVFTHHGVLGSASTISYLDSGVWNSAGTFSAPFGYKIKTLQENENLYFTSAAGIYKLDRFNSTPVLAGVSSGLDVNLTRVGAAGGFLAQDYRVAYRVVFGYRDLNNNLILGAPSGRAALTNTSTAANVTVRATLPSTVLAGYIYQIYRSNTEDQSSGVVEPNDELQLVFEGTVSSTDITNKYIEVTDIVPDALRGATIYTAPSQQGIAFGNDRPPLAKDITNFRDVTFYANTANKHRFNLTLIGTGGSALVADDTITIDGVVYTAKGAEDIGAAEFQVFTGGTPGIDIAQTADSLVRVINRHVNSTVYARYLSGPTDLPGQILLEERSIGGSAFNVISSKPSAFTPDLTSAVASKNDTLVNGLSWSKPFQPESVPLPNNTQVGSKNSPIRRILPLRDSLVILKDEGIFKLTGFYPNFDIELLDSSAKLVAPESPAILNNQIFCLTDQGVVAIVDEVRVVSLPIEDQILSILGRLPTEVRSLCFGVGYEQDRKYHLFLPTSSTDSTAQFSFVYNVFTQTWVKHTVAASCGSVIDGSLHLGDPLSNFVMSDRKNFTFLDNADFGTSTTITDATDNVITLGSGIDDVAIGDIIWQSDSMFAVVEEVNPLTSQVTVRTDPGFVVASAVILKSISTRIEWVPLTLGNPAQTKQLHTAQLLFKSDFQGDAVLEFSTDLVPAKSSVKLQGSDLGLWGLFPWGAAPWGGEPVRRPIRQWISREHQRCSQITVSFQHAVGYSPYQLQGISLHGSPGSEKTNR